MKISAIKQQARGALQGNWGLCVLLSFLTFLIFAIVPNVISLLFGGGWELSEVSEGSAEVAWQGSIANIIVSLLLIPLSVAVYWFYLSIARLEGARLSQVFAIYADWKKSLKLIGTSIVVSIFVFLWTLLFIIPGIIKQFSYSQTFFLLKDHPEYSILEAITESKVRMKGYKWKYFLLHLSFIGWGILSVITFGIGFLWLIPYITTSTATFYNELIKTQESQ
ncbi:DUF975 family protein [Peribacillus asahii]|uniref:Membrane protein n=1 Tax=Peribacillus asahii TaxID=228899 RepID=A0A3Q9RLQ2_9BACI|nr:DUF975 family protein [Peribacillus asahii]AZV42190.1 membrane protein [Peribacillus asahii]USK86507.1 DUF975 family protein [Peribacillus asahii]